MAPPTAAAAPCTAMPVMVPAWRIPLPGRRARQSKVPQMMAFWPSLGPHSEPAWVQAAAPIRERWRHPPAPAHRHPQLRGSLESERGMLGT